jgi:hypothetical protein
MYDLFKIQDLYWFMKINPKIFQVKIVVVKLIDLKKYLSYWIILQITKLT